MGGERVINVYPLDNYTFSVKEPRIEKDTSVQDRMNRMKQTYVKEGMRTSVEGVMLVHHHNTPHILLLQIGFSFFKLPGGRLKPGEDDLEGMRRKLTSKLGPSPDSGLDTPSWQVSDVAALWWRPNFENTLYPYCPPHITKPKECKKLFVIPLAQTHHFSVPRNLKIIAVPLFELYDNVQRYGPVIASLPTQLSRFTFNLVQQ